MPTVAALRDEERNSVRHGAWDEGRPHAGYFVSIVRFGRVAGRTRQAVAEHVRHDDEVLRRIERHARAEGGFLGLRDR